MPRHRPLPASAGTRHEHTDWPRLFGMLSVFSEFGRAMIRDRVMARLDRARAAGKRFGRPRTTPFNISRIQAALDEGRGVRETARAHGTCRKPAGGAPGGPRSTSDYHRQEPLFIGGPDSIPER
jgi:hypothetical protein